MIFLIKGKAPEKNEEKTKTEEWVSPLPKYENNLSLFDDDELKEIAGREKDETKLKVINHVMKQRGLKKSFSEKIYEVIKNIKVHSN